jgi:hypothetical protein
MLKIPFLRQLFGEAKSFKSLIVIKVKPHSLSLSHTHNQHSLTVYSQHPLTLNIALPKLVSWKSVHDYCHRESRTKRQSFMKNSRYVEKHDLSSAMSFFEKLLVGPGGELKVANVRFVSFLSLSLPFIPPSD